ncbi:MAG: leucine-rich repeat protein [Panacibacter sp.]
MSTAPAWIEIINREIKERTGTLDLGRCGLTTIPDEVVKMDWVTTLVLGNSQGGRLATKNTYRDNAFNAKDISYLVNQLTQLNELGMKETRLTEIPSLTNLRVLTFLDLSNNQISKIEGLETLNSLNGLELSRNQISKIEGLQTLTSLNTLSLSFNQISKIEGLQTLTGLTELDLSMNQISKIEGLQTLTVLKELFLFSNQISKVEGLQTLDSLNKLSLHSNRIIKIDGLQSLKNLNELILASNQISKIEELESLTNLETLSLFSNQISKIEGVEHLTSLKALFLSANQISKIDGLQSLKNLKTLYLSDNQISKVEGLETLNNLNELYLESNKITKIESIKIFPQSLSVLYIFNNPIENINVTIFGEGTTRHNSINDLKNFFAEDIEVNVPEVKLILTGNSDVGKTKFRTYLTTGMYDIARNSTHGLDVQEFHLNDEIKKTYAFSNNTQVFIWDFGGQEYFHNTHQLFFNQSAVYIFLWEKDTNKNQPVLTEISKDINGGNIVNRVLEQFDADYWLSNIRHFAPEASVIVVQNKVDNYERNNSPLEWLPFSTLRQYKCGNQYHISISESVVKNLSYWYDFEKLKHTIFNELKNFVSKNKEGNIYNQVRKEIEKRKKDNYWKAEDFILFIEDLKTKSASAKAADINNKLLIEHFCRQGKVLFPLSQELETGKLIFTNPQWLSEKIYQVLNDAVLQRNGFFEEKDLDKLVEDKKIESRVILEQIVALMLQFNIVFYNANKKQYVAPQYLPEVPTVHYSQVKKLLASPQLIIKVNGFLPKSVINNIIAKYAVNDDAANFYKYGVKTEADKNILLIESDYVNRKIYVYTDSKELVFIRDVFANIIKELGITQNISEQPLPVNAISNPDPVATRDNEIINTTTNSNIYVSIDDKIFVNWVELWNNHRNANRDKDYCTAEDGNMVLCKLFAPYYLPYAEVKNIKTADQKKPNKLFISYSSKNTEFMRRFETHLEPLKRNGMIELWHDRMIEPGTKWDDIIKEEMRTADIVVFLLSPDFIATNYIFESEIPQAIKQFESDNSKLFFVELQTCSWQRTVLARFQQTTSPTATNKGVITIKEAINDEKWRDVIDELEKKIKR